MASSTRISLETLTPGARLLLGMAIGDAFGARFENLKRAEITLSHEEELYRERNRYTDDTQMAIGIAELLISDRPFTRINLAEAFLAAYRRDPRPGYSDITRHMLEDSADGTSFLQSLPEEEIRMRKSDGAVMRALPLGVLADRREVIQNALISARITHGHPDSLAATVGIALIVHERYHQRKPFIEIIRDFPEIIPELTSKNREYLHRIITTGWNVQTILQEYESYGVPYTESIILLGAVIAILISFGEDPGRALKEAVLLGGDTDTTACIVLGAVCIHPGRENLAPFLIQNLEDGPYGRGFLIELGNVLNWKYPVMSS